MSKPAKPGSLRHNIEGRILSIEGVEDLQQMLSHVAEGERADYSLYNRKLILEQKEFVDSIEHHRRGKSIESLIQELMKKYNVNPSTLDYLPKVLSREDAKFLDNKRSKFYHKIQQYMGKANNQIASTKHILNAHDSIGILLMIFDQIPGIFPAVIHERIDRCSKDKSKYVIPYEHIDIVIYICHLKDMEIHGRKQVCGYIIRSDRSDYIDYTNKLIDVLTTSSESSLPRESTTWSDLPQQLRPDLFR